MVSNLFPFKFPFQQQSEVQKFNLYENDSITPLQAVVYLSLHPPDPSVVKNMNNEANFGADVVAEIVP